MAGFSIKNHWHNFYLVINVLIWAALIILLALLARPVFLSTGIVIGICSMLSVVSSAVLLRPGKRLAGGITQLVAWAGLILTTILFFPSTLELVLKLFLPAGLASLGFLALLGGLGLRLERQLTNAMKR